MQIESIRLKNFRAFADVTMKDIPKFCVLVGANGTGKSTLFSVFAFLRDAMSSNVSSALARLGGSRGLSEVRSRGSSGPIQIDRKTPPVLPSRRNVLIPSEPDIDEDRGKPVGSREILRYRRGSSGKPLRFLDFSGGRGVAVTN